MARYTPGNKRSALDQQGLRDLALTYVGRFATTRVRLTHYLRRKLRERGWAEEGEPDPDALVARLCELGYVDDGAYARMKGAAMVRRGLGAGRVRAALSADGVTEIDRAEAEEEARAGRWDAADVLARRRRVGPYAAEPNADPRLRERQIAMFIRAGHDMATARAWVDAAPGAFPERSE